MSEYEWSIQIINKGGEGSGHRGHDGRPGQVGGSVPSGTASPSTESAPKPKQGKTPFDKAATSDNAEKSEPLNNGTVETARVKYKGDGWGLVKPVKADAIPNSGAAFHDGRNEVIADEIDNLLGLDLVPTTVYVDHEGIGSTAQQWIDNATTGEKLKNYKELFSPGNEERITNIFVLDYLMGNQDRHGGNFLLDANGKIWAIDHGHSWLTKIGKGNNALWLDGNGALFEAVYGDWDIENIAISADVVDALEANRRNFKRMLKDHSVSKKNITAFEERLDILIEGGVIPVG